MTLSRNATKAREELRAEKVRGADKTKITCLNCKHLMFSDMYGECKIQLRIVNPSDTCEYAEKRIDDLDNQTEKCGSCEWAMPVKGTINGVYVSYIECQNPEKVWNHNSSRRKKRTTPKCRFWQPKKKGGEG